MFIFSLGVWSLTWRSLFLTAHSLFGHRTVFKQQKWFVLISTYFCNHYRTYHSIKTNPEPLIGWAKTGWLVNQYNESHLTNHEWFMCWVSLKICEELTKKFLMKRDKRYLDYAFFLLIQFFNNRFFVIKFCTLKSSWKSFFFTVPNSELHFTSSFTIQRVSVWCITSFM